MDFETYVKGDTCGVRYVFPSNVSSNRTLLEGLNPEQATTLVHHLRRVYAIARGEAAREVAKATSDATTKIQEETAQYWQHSL